MPEFVMNRLRSPKPAGCFIVQGSTPVIAFGDARNAKVATLGLNPSRQEFLDQNGRELVGEMRRFETLRSVGVASFRTRRTQHLQRFLSVAASTLRVDHIGSGLINSNSLFGRRARHTTTGQPLILILYSGRQIPLGRGSRIVLYAGVYRTATGHFSSSS
jgi:hypothetical protein